MRIGHIELFVSDPARSRRFYEDVLGFTVAEEQEGDFVWLTLDGTEILLRPGERKLLADESWGVSSIVFWELAKPVQLGRLTLDLEDREVVRTLGRLQVWPIDLDVARASTGLDFRGDPADELIAATSIVHGVPLLTRDGAILRSKLVPLAS